MKVLLEIVRFECRYQLRSAIFVSVAVAYFLVHFLAAQRMGINIGLQMVDASRLALNAAYSIIQNEAVLSVFGMFPALVFVATAITRDHERNTAETFFTAPITPRTFFFGRFLGGLIAAVIVGVVGVAGTLTALSMPWLDRELIGPFSVAPYWFSLLGIVLPNTLIVCALFYGVAALTRSMGAAFATLLIFLAGVMGVVALDADSTALSAALDPSGIGAILAQTRYWTGPELANQIPGGWVLINRGIWFGVALAVLLVTSWRYKFRLDAAHLPAWFRRRLPRGPAPAARVSVFEPQFNASTSRRQLASLLRMDLRSVLMSIPFYVVLALGIQGAIGYFNGLTFELFTGSRSIPVTSLMLDYFRFGMLQLAFLIVVYYSGELVHRDRQHRIAEIVDASPFPDGLSVFSKILTLCLVVTALMLVVACTFIVLQASSGYVNFELDLYLKGILGVHAFGYYMLCVLAVFIQILSPSKWIGMLVVIAVFIVSQVSRFYGFEHGLYGFSIPYVQHSDLNGYADFGIAIASFTVYWAAFCALLIIAGHLLYPRGVRDSLTDRMSAARSRSGPAVVAAAGACSVVFASAGAWIFYNTNILNEYVTTRDRQAARAEYERLYAHYAGQVGPQAAALDMEVDIFPYERRIESRGTSRMINSEDAVIDELPLFVNTELTVNELTVTGADLVESNSEQGFYLFRLAEPLRSGDEVAVTWDLSWNNEGFRNGVPNYRIVSNGTYIEAFEILPHRYDSEYQLTDNNARRRLGLLPVEPLPSPDDPQPPNLVRAVVAAETEVRVVIGTADDQIVVAPGRLLREWSDGGRRYFEYVGSQPGEAPLGPNQAIASARYQVARDTWNDVEIEIYHDAAHPYAIDTMLETVKAGLQYYSREFSPYQYDMYRIFEIPRYHTFARAFTGSAAYSEGVGFLGEPGGLRIDFATAHELAHEWWGAQLMGAQMRGSARLNETLANYSALMLIENVDGPGAARDLYMKLRDDYLSSRNFEPGDEGEPTLLMGDSLKGHLVLYTLRDRLGPERLHLALRRLIERYSFLPRYNSPPPPFPTSRDFVNEIRAVADNEHQALITDLYERVTFYDLRIVSATSRPVDAGYEVTIEISARQLDSTGGVLETEVPLSTYFDIGIYADASSDDPMRNPLYLSDHLVETGAQTVTIVVDSRPASVEIDPYGKMLDRNIADNKRAL